MNRKWTNSIRFSLFIQFFTTVLMLFSVQKSLALETAKIKIETNDLQLDETTSQNFKWKFRLGAEQDQTELTSSTLLNSHFDLEYSKDLNSMMSVMLRPSLSFESGQISSYKSEKSSESNVVLNAAWVELKYQPMSTQIGLIQPKYNLSEQILNSKNLIGFHTEFKFTEIKFQQFVSVIPSTVNTQKTSDNNNKSTFSSTQILWAQKQNTYLSQIQLGYFIFNDLNSGIASDAASSGNSTQLINNSENTFIYQYAGPFTELNFEYQLQNQWRAGLKYSATKNEKAPQGMNLGQSMTLKNKITLKNYSIELNSNYFRVEPDSILSSLSQPYLFQNNKVGYSNGLWLQQKNRNIKFGLGSGVNELIYLNSLQSSETFYWISLESNYANF